jgi:hypothetical protein
MFLHLSLILFFFFLFCQMFILEFFIVYIIYFFFCFENKFGVYMIRPNMTANYTIVTVHDFTVFFILVISIPTVFMATPGTLLATSNIVINRFFNDYERFLFNFNLFAEKIFITPRLFPLFFVILYTNLFIC